jgi:hypothetical protein
MTEEQWQACDDPIAMLEFLRGSPAGADTVTWWTSRWQLEQAAQGAHRKFRLFACACCRRVWDRIPFSCNRAAVDAVEAFLDGRLAGPALHAALVASSAAEGQDDESARQPGPGYWIVKNLGRGFYKMSAAASALVVASQVICMADEAYGREASLAFGACFYAGAGVFLRPFQWPQPAPAAVEAERATQATLLRCVFGNPFRPAHIDPSWRTAAVLDLARLIYERRQFDLMPVLGAALSDAGCAAPEILGHCADPGPHVRGCWVVDLLLDKA